MKKITWARILPAFLFAFSLSGCSDSSGPKSMTEGVPLSEIEAYEQSVRDMEAEEEGDMDDIEKQSSPPK